MLEHIRAASPIYASLIVAIALSPCSASRAWPGEDPPSTEEAGAPIQVIADIAAIQATCWNLEVNPGVAFEYGESHGVHMSDVLPGGRRRQEFNEASAKTSMIDRDELCNAVATKYAADLPGSIVHR